GDERVFAECHRCSERDLPDGAGALLDGALGGDEEAHDLVGDDAGGGAGTRGGGPGRRGRGDGAVLGGQFVHGPAGGEEGSGGGASGAADDDRGVAGVEADGLVEARGNADLPGDADDSAAAKDETELLHGYLRVPRLCRMGAGVEIEVAMAWCA